MIALELGSTSSNVLTCIDDKSFTETLCGILKASWHTSPNSEYVPLHELSSFAVVGVTLLSRKMSKCGTVSSVYSLYSS